MKKGKMYKTPFLFVCDYRQIHRSPLLEYNNLERGELDEKFSFAPRRCICIHREEVNGNSKPNIIRIK